MPKFKTFYTDNEKVSKVFEKPSKTEQDYKDECDIGFIIKNFVRTGQLPVHNTAQFGDTTLLKSYQDSMLLVAECKSNFEMLPSNIRDEFKTVDNYLSYISDSNNLKDCYERNLIDRNLIDIKDVYPERYVQSDNQIDKPVLEPSEVAQSGATVEGS